MSRPYHRYVVFAVLALAAVVLYRNAWLGDDAFITFRTVDNFVNGLGLTWNPGERVQAFTHPLWMFLLSGCYFFTGEIFLTGLFLSMAVTMAALALFAFGIARNYIAAVLGLGLLLVSKAFIDYSTSGLENPLTYLLITVFFMIYIRGEFNRQTLLKLALTASLAAVNRLDTILLFLPALAFYVFKNENRAGSIKTLLIGFAPLILWELFSLFYYGFLFPNTAYAKLNTGIGSLALIKQGGYYFNHLWMRSPSTALAIVLAVALNLRYKANRNFPLMLGIVIYLFYILKIGGDFMTGRFFSAPFLMSVLVLSQYGFERAHRLKWAAVVVLIVLGMFWPKTPLWSGASYGARGEKFDWLRGISDERAASYEENGLLNVSFAEDLPNSAWCGLGREVRESGEKFVVRFGIGQFGFCAGPGVHILDGHALADPLLARLPLTSLKNWRIAHFRRIIPEGYEESLITGENRIFDKDLARYYDALSLVVRGNLFSFERLWVIVKLNLGFYDRYIDAYLSHPLYHLTYKQARKPVPKGTRYNHNACRLINRGGININFGGRKDYPYFELSVDSNDEYRMTFYDDTVAVGSVDVPPTVQKEGGMAVDTVVVPRTVVEHGFDNVVVTPVRGDDAYSFGHIKFFRQRKEASKN